MYAYFSSPKYFNNSVSFNQINGIWGSRLSGNPETQTKTLKSRKMMRNNQVCERSINASTDLRYFCKINDMMLVYFAVSPRGNSSKTSGWNVSFFFADLVFFHPHHDIYTIYNIRNVDIIWIWLLIFRIINSIIWAHGYRFYWYIDKFCYLFVF